MQVLGNNPHRNCQINPLANKDMKNEALFLSPVEQLFLSTIRFYPESRTANWNDAKDKTALSGQKITYENKQKHLGGGLN
jgi:hypothetical protein